MLSGRPLYSNPQINAADAFVEAWLPGSEGEGIADVLTGKYDFTGKLSFSWPKRPDQTPLNVRDATYDPQFAYGFGLSYAAPAQTPALPEVTSTTKYGQKNVYYAKGTTWNGYKLSIGDSNASQMDYVGTRTTLSGSAGLVLESQADGALHAVWKGKSKAWLQLSGDKPSDISREANGAMMLSLTVRVNTAPATEVRLGVGSASVPVTAELKALPVGSYATLAVPLSCFSAQDLNEDPDRGPFGNFRQSGSVGVRNPPNGNQNGRGLPHEVKDFQEGTKQGFRSHRHGSRPNLLPAGSRAKRYERHKPWRCAHETIASEI
jgi:beta-glucosidase